MRILKMIMGLVLLFLCLPALNVAAEDVNQQYIVTSQGGVTMTASADENGMAVAKLKKGTRVNFVRQESKWVKVDYNGRLGWVSSEKIAPFTKELLPAYSTYYKLLENTDHLVYALLSDFTQDGVEDLYVILDANPEKGQYQEFIYSGDNVIYQKNIASGLTVLKSSTDYILWHHAQTNSDKKYKLSELNSQAKTDYYEASAGKGSYKITTNAYLNSYFIVQSGNGVMNEATLTYEQIASKDYSGADNKNDYDESIYLENYALSTGGKTQSLQAKDFDEQFSMYENSKVVKVIYEDNYKSAVLSDRFSFDVERVKKELLDLAADAMQANQLDSGAADMETLQQKLAQSALLEMPYSAGISRNAVNYFKIVEQAIPKGLVGYDSSTFEMTSDDKETTYNRAAVDALIYDFYGLKMNSEAFNRLANDEGYMVDDEKYTAGLKEPLDDETYMYRQLVAVESLENQYVAVKFTDYEMPQTVNISPDNEAALIAGVKHKNGYVLFKSLPFKSGVKWVYIDTVDQLESINDSQYTTYENSLDIIQKLIAEQKTTPSEFKEPVEEEKVENVQQPQQPTQPTEQSNTWVIFLAIGILIASSITMYYKKFYKQG